MATVVLSDNLVSFTGGLRELNTSAGTYRELTAELIARWPELAEHLNKSAVAIDGHIYQDAFLQPIGAESEVFFMARIEGG